MHEPWGVTASAKLAQIGCRAQQRRHQQTGGNSHRRGNAAGQEAISATLYGRRADDAGGTGILRARSGGRKPGANLFWNSSYRATAVKPGARGRTIGFRAIRAYGKRLIWRALGRHRQITAKVRISDPVDALLYSDARVRLA